MKKHLYIIICAVSTIMLIACDDFLGKNPTNRADLATTEDLSSLLVFAYPQMSYFPFVEVMSDNVTDVGNVVNEDVERRNYYHWEEFLGMKQDSPHGFWNSTYASIAASNHVLRAIERMLKEGTYTEETLNPYKGEALMTRAYNHFMLVNIFAEHYNPNKDALAIPYITTVEEEPKVIYDRLSVHKIYDLIEKDMLEGYALISDAVYGSQPKWHFNKTAAAVFMSRFYLYRSLTAPDANGKNDFDKVIQYVEATLGKLPTIRDWSVTYEESMEVFLADYCKSGEAGNLLLQSVISTGSCLRVWANRYTMDISLLRKRLYNFHPTVGLTQEANDAINNDFLLRYKALGNSSVGCYSIFKLNEYFKRSGINANYGMPYVMFPAIVAEEGLFNLAEAYVMKGNYARAIELLNLYYSKRTKDYNSTQYEITDDKIRGKFSGTTFHPDITPSYTLNATQKIYLKCILAIRATEFYGEGQRWFDIKRMHMVIEHKFYPNNTTKLAANDERRVVPLPPDALTATNIPSDPTNLTIRDANLKTELPLSVEDMKALQPFVEIDNRLD